MNVLKNAYGVVFLGGWRVEIMQKFGFLKKFRRAIGQNFAEQIVMAFLQIPSSVVSLISERSIRGFNTAMASVKPEKTASSNDLKKVVFFGARSNI